ncbi:hypothetical protein Taro_034443 [Colocasia esculenta]|uniref:Protein EARLY HEADING DATE 2 n=1 Tax=Colocasia esculenta TaxID=4460 RepID=A0A843VWF2_COLES|nr:hypothetical protein [Colocasia esculenta]
MMKGLLIQQHPAAAEENMSNLTSASGEASGSSNQQSAASQNPNPSPAKKKRKLPGNPDPDAEVMALSPKTLLSTNRFVCEICNKGFQRDQNLQLHRRGHNLPWKLRQRSSEAKKKVYICPEANCVHHDPARALGDLTGIKKHFCRKHGEKKWKCDKCSKKYAVQSDWKAHSKTCGTREYRCDCGTLFSRRDSFITHRAFCDALAEESARAMAAAPNPLANHRPFLFSQATTAAPRGPSPPPAATISLQAAQLPSSNTSIAINSHGLHDLTLKREEQQQLQGFDVVRPEMPPWLACQAPGPGPQVPAPHLTHNLDLPPSLFPTMAPEHGFAQENPSPAAPPPHMSATALLHKAAQIGSTMSRPADHAHMAPAHTASSASAVASAAASFGLGLYSHQEIMGSFGGPPAMVQNMVMGPFSLAASGNYDGSFEEALGGILGSRREVSSSNGVESLAGRNEGGVATSAGGADGLTRDFLGLRALSHRDLLNMAGLEPCMSSTSSSYEQPQQSKKPWN